MTSVKGKTMVIGLGNDERGDDAVGLLVVRRLRERNLAPIMIQEFCGDVTRLLDVWSEAETVILVDAVSSGGVPGTWRRMDLDTVLARKNIFRFSSHGTSLAEVLELARALNRLPQHVEFFGIEGKSFDAGQGVSAEVLQGVEEAVGAVMRELNVSNPEGKTCTSGI